VDVAVMVEGQNGLTWPRWKRLAAAVEDLGFELLGKRERFARFQEALEVITRLLRSAEPASFEGRYATEWNASHQTPEAFAALNRQLDELLERCGRQPGPVRRSMMTGIVFGRKEAEVVAKLGARGVARETLRARGILVGTPAEVRDQLAALAMAGVQGVMLQWLDLDDIEGLKALAKTIDQI
jgi:alkanesulfonate monooxygenase SsuD/methylene tetrahydromethanopterin reductase-like flavin-dependent oxidoreductase (luciferase family)